MSGEPPVSGLRLDARTVARRLASAAATEQRVGLAASRLLAPHLPPPWGRSASAADQLVVDEELAAAGIGRPDLGIGEWALPTIARYGSAEQQRRWMAPTLRGELVWCQLFSEPDAGSDLASLRTRADRTGGGWLLSGTKLWVSLAVHADLGICLARTDPEAPKRAGLSYFVVDMHVDGVEIRPLREMTGRSTFNEVALDRVFVADESVVGLPGEGWRIATATLSYERVTMSRGAALGNDLAALLAAARQSGPALSAARRDGIAAAAVDAGALTALRRRMLSRAVAGATPGTEASVAKLFGAQLEQRVEELGLALHDAAGMIDGGDARPWIFGLLLKRCVTIAGGTSEIQRTVIGERVLGLPREPRSASD
jgi:alkylation response protein AidB-like acyl-CoA dehydrogenase